MDTKQRILDLIKEERIEEANEMIIEELDYKTFLESNDLFLEIINLADNFYYQDKKNLTYKILEFLIDFLRMRVATPALHKAYLKLSEVYIRDGKESLARDAKIKADFVLSKLED